MPTDESGNYVLTFTAAGDPSTVHFESLTIVPNAQTSTVISIFDTDPNDTGLWSVRSFFAGGGSGPLGAVDSTATARLFHASTVLVEADIYSDETLMAPPIVINHAGWIADLIREVGAGLVLDPTNIELAAEHLVSRIRDSSWLARSAAAARRLALDRFDRNLHARQLEQVLLTAVRERRRDLARS